jgi:hypothetical protein
MAGREEQPDLTDEEHTARILAAAVRAVPRPDEDEAEWQGEYEE